MALGVDKNNLPPLANGDRFIQAQQEAQSKVKSSPFANMNLGKIQVEQDPNFGGNQQRQTVQQTQYQQQQYQTRQAVQPQRQVAPRPAQQSRVVNRNTGNRITTSNGVTLKVTPNGNTYAYEDKLDHSNEVTSDKVEKFLLRLPAEFKARLEMEAKRVRKSLNQYILQILEKVLYR